MRIDNEIERDVKAQLEWEPELDAINIAVAVKDGVVTLAGFVRTYSEKVAAELAAKRVAGVTGVANDIEVRIPAIDDRPDPEIAREAVAAIRTQLPFSWQHIKVIVKDGYVTMEGEVEWQNQRELAEASLRRLKGIKGVTNLIKVKPRIPPEDIKRRIEDAFRRSAEIDAGRIVVETHGSEVILKGTVRSWAEREEAKRVAWSAPGVTEVIDQIVVSH